MTGSITPLEPSGCLTAEQFIAGRGMFDRGRPLKRWRWVGVFDEELMACAAQVRIGPARQSFWALYTPATGALRERTRLVPRGGEVELVHGSLGDGTVADGTGEDPTQLPGVLRIADRGVRLEMMFEEERGFVARCPNGRSESWTRKQAGVRAHGTISLDGRPPRPVQARAVIDDSAGYHARVTEWRWSAGVGVAPDGTPLAWNLVAGINDPPAGSERAVWVGGYPREVGPVEFDAALRTIRGEDGSELRFTAGAERSRRENLLLVSSDYRAPFGTFAGTLPGGIELAQGRGVMEHHRARW
jgi:hypothetical protein